MSRSSIHITKTNLASEEVFDNIIKNLPKDNQDLKSKVNTAPLREKLFKQPASGNLLSQLSNLAGAEEDSYC